MELISISRSIEIIVGMLIGGLLCWLGYRLFEIGVSGKASLIAQKGEIKFQLINASPGIFFALFGSVLIIMGITQTTKYHEKSSQGNKVNEIKFEKGNEIWLSETKQKLIGLNQKLFNKGEKNYVDENYGVAVNIFSAIVDSNDKFADSCNALSWLYVKKGENLDRAVQLAKSAVSLKPDRVAFWHTLAKAYLASGKKQEAKAALEFAIEKDPSNNEVQAELEKLK